MDGWLSRIAENLADRVTGPMRFRLVLQPLMAVIFAARDGMKDARGGRPPWFWAVFTDPEHRRDLLRDGWKSVGTVFLVAVAIDAIYQYVALRWFYPAEALLVAGLLAFVPYVLLRGPVNRVFGRGRRGPDTLLEDEGPGTKR